MRQFDPLFARLPVVIAIFAFAAVSLVGCSQGAKWQTLKVSDGATVRWSPSVPAIGDLVRLEAMVPGATSAHLPVRAGDDASSGSALSPANGAPSDSGSLSGKVADSAASASVSGESPVSVPSVKSPSATMIAPVSVEYLPSGTRYVWSFRVTRAGDWSFVSGEKADKLWSTATVAGNATELEKLDAGGLWKGTLKKAPAAQPSSKGVSPAPGNSPASGSTAPAPLSPAQGTPAAPGQPAPQQAVPASPTSPGKALPVPAPKAVTL
jgi:hypothetical protein